MVEADPVMRGARNGFLVTVVVLVAIGGYQFATEGTVTVPIVVTWIVAVLTYYSSQYYYRYSEDSRATER
ncbi:hypothetical protein Hrd1104_00345 [Halorhabdus sp. CBA1104]|uniref:hypothetical protein n=1 Tax=Halorhabdus sp. CBA1104 TaxID=1380432 RepID=UPI0012B30688|nr:hypothetical protein [Halorhabdus sp. CBA1104]QGN08140.1 hypothetical protein Hrd1104_00345 [Halorhabdus sp. CBA1104]